MKSCQIEGCDRVASGSMCGSHRARKQRWGNPLAGRSAQGLSLKQRFLNHVDAEVDFWTCAEWGGAKSPRGYGKFNLGNKKTGQAHRSAWELFRSPIPEGLVIDHWCENHSCVNPFHLRPVTQKVNLNRPNVRVRYEQTRLENSRGER